MRITESDLERKALLINKKTGSPVERFSQEGESWKSQAGHYYVEKAYGGYALSRIVKHGGEQNVFSHASRYTRRELFGLMDAYLKGIELERGER